MSLSLLQSFSGLSYRVNVHRAQIHGIAEHLNRRRRQLRHRRPDRRRLVPAITSTARLIFDATHCSGVRCGSARPPPSRRRRLAP